MSKHFIMWTEGDEADAIEVYQEDSTFLVIADKQDIAKVGALDEAKKAGIYILWSVAHDKRYVGQASGAVYSRLSSHNREKLWWDKVVFFGRVDGHLDKSQLDYLEAKLIGLFTDAGFIMDNGTVGNSSYIYPYQRGISETLWSATQRLLRDVVKVDLFKRTRKMPKPPIATSPAMGALEVASRSQETASKSSAKTPPLQSLFVLTDKEERHLEAVSMSKLFRDYFGDVLVNSDKRQEYRDSGIVKLSATQLFGKNDHTLATEIEPGLFLYTNESRVGLLDRFKRFSEKFDLGITLHHGDQQLL